MMKLIHFCTTPSPKKWRASAILMGLWHILYIISSNDPGYVGMYYHLGKLYEKMGEPELALEAYTAGINVAKKIPDFHALSELNNAKLNLEMEM
jgi:hypothetical protein